MGEYAEGCTAPTYVSSDCVYKSRMSKIYEGPIFPQNLGVSYGKTVMEVASLNMRMKTYLSLLRTINVSY